MLQSGFSSNIPHETETAISVGPDGTFIVPDGFMLFASEFGRDGADVLVQDPSGTVLRLADFFQNDALPDVLSSDGASLAGRVVERLAGPLFPGQYAQAGGVALSDAIGQVEAVSGDAFAQRTDGSVVRLEIGTKVFQGDVVRTDQGSTLGLTFTDGTIFTLASGSRMVLDELIYDPQSSENSGIFDLVEGGFVFIAGQAAGTGGIEINTPAATMGIRGTTVKVDIQTTNGVATVTVSLNPDPDGGTGAIELFDLAGNLISTITNTDTKWIIRPPFTNEPPLEVERFAADLSDDAVLLSQAVAAFQSAVARVAQGETFVELDEGDSDAPDDDAPIENDLIDDGAEEIDETPPPPPLDETGDGTDSGESGSGNPELDGTDDPLPEGDTAPTGEDDAELQTDTGGTEIATNGNGAPEFAPTPILSVEDTPITGRLPVTDRDGDAFEVTLVRGAQNGSVVLDTDGVFTYTPNPNFEGTDSFIVTAEDSEGAVSESEITVVVDSVNDAPVVDFAVARGSAFESSPSTEEVSSRATGRVTYSDVDEADVVGVWSIAAASSNTTAFGTIAIDAATGDWTYDLDQDAADVLAQDQDVVETFIASVTDGEGAVDTTTVEITVTGSNDGPVITSNAPSETLSESITGFNTLVDEGETPPDPIGVEGDGPGDAGSVTGALSFVDVDQGDTPGQWSVIANATNTTALGSVTIDAPTGVWVYTLDERAADVLSNGDSVLETFTATVTDAFGATASQQIAITVTGFNDAPTIEFSIEDIEATVFEDGFANSATESALPALRLAAMEGSDASGTLRYTDPDGQPGDTASWSVSPDGPSLGAMVIDAATGEWHYTLDEAAAQSLRDGEEVIETFTATVTDTLGAASQQTITITVIGSNDASEIIATTQDLTGSADEGGTSTASGILTFVDPDAAPGEVAQWSVTPVGDTRGSMTIDPTTGAWLYTLDQTLADSLGQGAQVDELFTARLTDAFGATSDQTITITLTGENDAPVITQAQTSGTVVEAGAGVSGTAQASGTITAVDPDADGAISIWTIVADAGNTTAFGEMTIDPVSGTWTYTLDEAGAEALTTGDSFVERFVATISDPFGGTATQEIDVTIEGTNDAPVVVNGTGTAVEGGAAITFDLSALASDVDVGEDGSTLIYALVGTPAQGSAQINGTELVFAPGDDFAALAANETADVVLNFTATDAGGVSVSGSVTITVTGTNSAPTFVVNATADIAEDAPSLTIDLAAFGADPDANEDGSTLSYALASAPAEGSAQVVGTDLVFTPGDDFAALAAGDTATVLLNVTATDSGGTSVNGTVTLTITGTNSAPELAGTSLSLSEDTGDITLDLATLGSDPDTGEDGSTLSYEITGAPTAGTAAIDGTTLRFETGSAFDTLGQGETQNVDIAVTATDAAGDTATSIIVITVTGTNDAPQIVQAVATGMVVEAGTIAGTATAAGGFAYTDADESSPGEGVWTITPQNATFGAIGIDASTGDWLYTLDNTAADSLNAGETRSETFVATVTDAAGARDSQTITVSITGTNDAPRLSSTTENIDADTSSIVIALDPLASDVDSADTDATLEYAIARAPTSGTLTLVGDTLRFAVGTDFDSLPNGETETVTFDIRVTDSSGASTVTEMSVVVTGTQTAPEITSSAAQAEGSVTEDVTLTAGGTLAYDDPDAATPTSGVWSVAPATSALGSIQIDATTGDWLYALNAFAADSLNAGEVLTESFTATITDADGLTDSQAITVTITGSNDAPSLTAQVSALSENDAAVTVDLRANASDVDSADTDASLTFAIVGQPSAGVAGVTGGTLRFDPDGAFEDLATGDVRSIFVDVEVRDTQGATSVSRFQFDVTGTNDAPVIDLAGSTIIGSATEPSSDFDTSGGPDATGTLLYTDVDEPANAPGTWSVASVGTEFGTLDINATTGAWTYVVDDAATDFLRQGATVEDRYIATITDADGATDTQEITLTITGTNDRPEVNAVTSVTEGTHTEEGQLSVSGQLAASDPDDTVSAPVWSIQVDTALGGNAYGTMTINAATGVWTYTADPTAVAPLGEGDTEVEHYIATVTDEFGATSTISVGVTIFGTNTAPEIVATPSQIIGTVVEAGTLTPGTALARATLDYVDVDEGSTAGAWSVIATDPAQFGDASIGATSGQWSYALSQVLADSLGAGQVETDTFSVIYTDAEGAASEPQQITITIQGTNDAALITGATTGAVTEDGGAAAIATGNLDHTDVDENNANDTWQTVTNGTSDEGYGTVQINAQGVWTYTLDNTNPLINSLRQGETTSDTFTATTQDGTTELVTVSITGANDAPSYVDGPPSGSAVEDGDVAFLDLLEGAFDPDSGETGTLSIENVSGLVPGITVSDNIVTIDPTNATFQSIPAETDRQFTLTYDIVDASGGRTTETATIDVAGRNDAPTLSIGSATANEDDAEYTLDLTLLAGDVDEGEDASTLSYTVFSQPDLGTASIENGVLSIAPGADYEFLEAGEETTVTVGVFALDGNEQTSGVTNMTFTVTGENDAPDITTTGNLAFVEGAGTPVSGPLLIADRLTWAFTDADLANVGHTTSISGLGVSGVGTPTLPTVMASYLSITTVKPAGSDAGAITINFSAPDADFDYLSQDETVTLEYQLTVNDGETGRDAETFEVTITGTNDTPEFTTLTAIGILEAAATSNSTEVLSGGGRNEFTDVDLSDIGHSATVTDIETTDVIVDLPDEAALRSFFNLTTTKDAGSSTGYVDWTFGAQDRVFDYLAAGDIVRIQYEITLNDGDGPSGEDEGDSDIGTTTVVVGVSIIGTNDLPFYTTPLSTFTGDEDSGLQSIDLLAGAVDLDNEETPDIVGAPMVQPGISIASDRLFVDFDNAAFQDLSQGETRTIVVNYRLEDGSGSGAFTPSAVTVVVTGVNDAPTLTDGMDGGSADSEAIEVDLSLLGNDVDNGSTLSYEITSAVAEGMAEIDGSTLVFNPDGDFFDLGSGNSRDVTIQIQARDAEGALSAIQPVVITVNGVSTPATITGPITGEVTEDEEPGTADGDLDSVDIDATDANDAWQATSGPVSTTYGTYEITTDGQWDYRLSNGSAAVNELGASSAPVFDTFTVRTDDGTEQVITITVNGSNDAAVITPAPENGGVGVAVNEFGFTGSISRDVDSTDVDGDNGRDVWTEVSSPTATVSGVGTYTVSSDGVWTYTADPLDPAIDGLNAPPDEPVDRFNDSFTISTIDGTEQLITIEIQGFNDAATIAGVISGSVTEDDINETTFGTATSTDVDNPDDIFIVQSATRTLSDRGTFSVDVGGAWTYTLDNTNAEVNALTGGATLGDLFTIASQDGTQQIINITITGNDDAPTIGGDITGTLIEDDGDDIFTGNLTIQDPDSPAQTWVPQSLSLPLTGAGFSINAEGQWNYSINNASPFVDGLSVGEFLEEEHTVTTSGGIDQILTVTITGVNDTPAFTEAGFASFAETAGVSNSAAIRSVSDTQAFTDVDLSDIGHTASVEVRSLSNFTDGVPTDATLESFFTLTPTKNAGDAFGQVAWQFDAADNVFDYLPQGESVIMDFWISVDDGDGGSSRANARLQVSGSNDLPFYTTPLSPLAGNEGSGTSSIDLLTNADDLDFGETAGLTITNVTGLEPGITFSGSTLTADFSDAAFDYLEQGEERTITINFDLSDSLTTATASSIDVVITGVNDAPETTPAVEAITLSAPLDTSGPEWIEFNGHFYQYVDPAVGLSWTDAQAAANAAGGYLANVTSQAEMDFLLTLNGGSVAWLGGSDAADEGVWIWAQGPEAGQQFWQGTASGNSVGGLYENWDRNAGGSLVQPDGGSENALHIFGDGSWNDITDGPGTLMDYFIEYSGPPALRGSLAANANDVDGDPLTFTDLNATDLFTLNADGTWAFDQTDAAVQEIAAGAPVQFNFNYEVDDGTDTTVGTIRFDFTGLNDAPTLTPNIAVATVNEDTPSLFTVENAFFPINNRAFDPDFGEDATTLTYAYSSLSTVHFQIETTPTAGIILFIGGNYDYLAAGDTTTETAIVTATDAGGAVSNESTLTWTITGVDDAAVVDNPNLGTVIEDSMTSSASGTLTYTDVDDASTLWVAQPSVTTTYGTFTLQANGDWTYTLDDGRAATNALDDGQTVTDTFSVTTDTGILATATTASVSIDVVGTDDPGEITGMLTGMVTEDTTLTAMGVVMHSDVDDGPQAITAATTSGTYGTFEVSALGAWTYTLDSGASNAAVQALNTGTNSLGQAAVPGTDTFTVTSANGDVSEIVTITVLGTDDPAVVGSGDITGSVIEDGTLVASGSVNHTDPDDPNGRWSTISAGTPTTYGTVEMNFQGNWTYTLDNGNAAVEALNDTETLTDTFTAFTADSSTPQTVTITINGNTDAPALMANDDSGFIQTINVLVVGTVESQIDVVRAQLNGANGDRFNFNAIGQKLNNSADWNATIFDGIDVVLLGGIEDTIDLTTISDAYELMANYHLDGGNVVTTGGVDQQFYDIFDGTDNEGFLDTITPIGNQSGGTSTGSNVFIIADQDTHPIVVDVAVGAATPGQVSGVGLWNSVSSGMTDTLSIALARAATTGTSHSISILEGSGVANTPGNLAYVGGRYLDSVGNAAFRTGDADALLEQALAWAAGVQKIAVNEDVPFTFLAETLFANDIGTDDPLVEIISTDFRSQNGAGLNISNGDIVYTPFISRSLDALDDGEFAIDTFSYTITNDGGTTTSTATVSVRVDGVTDAGSPPVLNSALGEELNGFAQQNPSRFDFGQTRYIDDDPSPTQVNYNWELLASPSAELPAGFNFDQNSGSFTVQASSTVSYREDLLFVAYEPDGQNNFAKVGYSVDGGGHLRFVSVDFTPATPNDTIIEIGFDQAVGAGVDAMGPGDLVDLSGVGGMPGIANFAPNLLPEVATFDMRNGQETTLEILNAADWLTFFDVNPATDGARTVTIEADPFDNFFSDSGDPSGGVGWRATLTDNPSGTPDIVRYFANGAESDYGTNGFNFLTLTIDGTENHVVA